MLLLSEESLQKRHVMSKLSPIPTSDPSSFEKSQIRQLSWKDLEQQSQADQQRSNVTEEIPSKCRNTQDRGFIVVDERGYMCKRYNIDPKSGCCGNNLLSNILSQNFCNDSMECHSETQCCKHYEFCVHCCLTTQNTPLSNVLRQKQWEGNVDNIFDYCRSNCRTNSKSVFHENTYRSDFKYCFGDTMPPLIPKKFG